MIHGSHLVIYTQDPEADRALFRDVLGFHCVDAGEGWLVFGLPPAELAFHPAEANDRHELFLMCEDLQATTADLERNGVSCGEALDEGWGIRTTFALPGGGKIGLYQPRHPVAF